jgi:hypothetical protein
VTRNKNRNRSNITTKKSISKYEEEDDVWEESNNKRQYRNNHNIINDNPSVTDHDFIDDDNGIFQKAIANESKVKSFNANQLKNSLEGKREYNFNNNKQNNQKNKKNSYKSDKYDNFDKSGSKEREFNRSFITKHFTDEYLMSSSNIRRNDDDFVDNFDNYNGDYDIFTNNNITYDDDYIKNKNDKNISINISSNSTEVEIMVKEKESNKPMEGFNAELFKIISKFYKNITNINKNSIIKTAISTSSSNLSLDNNNICELVYEFILEVWIKCETKNNNSYDSISIENTSRDIKNRIYQTLSFIFTFIIDWLDSNIDDYGFYSNDSIEFTKQYIFILEVLYGQESIFQHASLLEYNDDVCNIFSEFVSQIEGILCILKKYLIIFILLVNKYIHNL